MAFGGSGMAGDAADLLKKLRAWGSKKTDLNTLLLIDLGDLGLPEDDEYLQDEIAQTHTRIARVRGGEAYQLSPSSSALLVSLSEMNKMEVPQELKMNLFKLLQEEFPEKMAGVDQSKLVRSIDLTTQMMGAVKFLEAFEDRAKEQGVMASADGSRSLGFQDIQTVRSFHAKTGDKAFAETYIAGQPIALISGDNPPQAFAKEFYVRMDLLRSDALQGAEIRESDPMFTLLSQTLDSLVLASAKLFNPEGAKCAINLNLESVTSNAFQTFLAGNGAARLNNVIVEFKLANVLQDLRKFHAASKTIRDLGGNVALDIIDPAVLGLLNLSGFGVNIAKIIWRASGAEDLARNRAAIRQAQEKGCIVVLCRVESKLGIRVGREMGISAFQGFHVDELLL